ncbi:hypothetical protein D3C80_2103880 [compost metagenome]
MARSPKPPAPTAPAMAEALIMAITQTVMPPIRPGSASGRITWRTMCQRRKPMAWAASISPWSTSFRLTWATRV